MSEKMRRSLAWLSVVVGVALGAVSAGPLAWGLGCFVAVGLIVHGWYVLTDRRPQAPEVRVTVRGDAGPLRDDLRRVDRQIRRWE